MVARHPIRQLPVQFGAFVCACVVAAFVVAVGRAQAPASASGAAPQFEVDPNWPQALPNNWVLGPVSGIGIDGSDHIVLVQRNESDSVKKAGGVPAPHVVEFDPAGKVVRAWGGPGAGYTWMEQVHGLTIDHKNRVWISGNGDHDAHLLVFTRTGELIRQVGTPGSRNGSNDTRNLGAATQMRFDPPAGDLFVSDGEQNRNHRVIVLDADTGA